MVEWSDVLKLSIPVLPVFLAFLGWLLNESSKRYWERHKRKEERYIALLESLKGFYVSTGSATARDEKDRFLQQLSVGWLYCPDSVIRQIYLFLKNVSVGERKSDEEKERAVGEIVSLMRKDLLGKRFWFWDRTSLKASDYRHLKAT